MADRWKIEELLSHLVLGYRCRFSQRDIREAYPPRGMDLLHVLALDRGGNRPEPVMTSDDQIRQFCARNGIRCESYSFDGFYEFERLREKHGKCGGRGFIQRIAEPLRLSGDLPLSEAFVTIVTDPCAECEGRGYIAAKGDPDARFGDHSASDAWIRNRRRVSAPSR